MAKGQNNYFLNNLLNLLTNPVHRRRQQNRVAGPNGHRIIGETIDETGIGNQNETDNQIAITEYILDCGHTARDGLGGRCHYCDLLVCKNCISLCSSCGHSVCPQDSLIANFDGQNKPYCRLCAEEIKRSLKLQAVGKSILSFFVSNDQGRQQESK
ncbi:MAG: hypothetical protein KAV87_05080 [Desulfobacteraceae bacterium]|nr:hypothetical protein [Desulfobacteraceae bacterium]